MIDLKKQLLNPNDDSYIDTGIKEGTFEVTGMSGDTSPEFRAQLGKEREAQKDQELAEYYEAMYPEEIKGKEAGMAQGHRPRPFCEVQRGSQGRWQPEVFCSRERSHQGGGIRGGDRERHHQFR